MNTPPSHRRAASLYLWRSLSLYLPVLLMGGLALTSYWVLRDAPSAHSEAPPPPVQHKPDYFMRVFSVKTYDASGMLTGNIHGDELRHFPDDGTIEVDRARLFSQKKSPQATEATADLLSTDARQETYRLQGNVIVTQRGPLVSTEFRSESLVVIPSRDLVISDTPVVMVRNGDRITADSLRYDDGTGVAELQGRVRATLAP